MASVQRKGNKFAAVYYVKSPCSVKSKPVWEYFDTEEEAKTRVLEINLEKKRGTLFVPQGITFRKFFETSYTELYISQKWRGSTYKTNMSNFRNHILPEIGDKLMKSITPLTIETMFSRLKEKKQDGFRYQSVPEEKRPCLSQRTIQYIYVLVHKAFKKAVEWKVIRESPVIMEKPTVDDENEREVWEADEFLAVLNEMELDSKDDLLHLALHTAFIASGRSGEILGLTWDAVDFQKGKLKINKTLQRLDQEAIEKTNPDYIIRIFPSVTSNSKSNLVLQKTKTKKSIREIFLTQELARELMERKQQVEKDKAYFGDAYQNDNLVFCFSDGRPIEPKRCLTWFKKWQDRSGIDLTKVVFHSIRHTSSTFKLQVTGFDVKNVQAETGHATASQLTDRYAHSSEKERRRYAEKYADAFYRGNFLNDKSKKIWWKTY